MRFPKPVPFQKCLVERAGSGFAGEVAYVEENYTFAKLEWRLLVERLSPRATLLCKCQTTEGEGSREQGARRLVKK